MKFCSLYSGSSGNSIFISSGNARILVDAGMAGKKIDEALKSIDENPKDIDGIFITHEHIDHVKGVGVLSRKYDIPIYANEPTWVAMEKSIGNIKSHNVKFMDRRSSVSIKDLDIRSFNIPHDAAAPVGYSMCCNGKICSVATDMGTFTEEIKENIKESDVMLIESNHDVQMVKYGPYPYPLKTRILSEIGHLSNDDCGNAILDLLRIKDKRKIFLGHLSNTNNYPELAYKTVSNILEENDIVIGDDVYLSLAERNNASECYIF